MMEAPRKLPTVSARQPRRGRLLRLRRVRRRWWRRRVRWRHIRWRRRRWQCGHRLRFARPSPHIGRALQFRTRSRPHGHPRPDVRPRRHAWCTGRRTLTHEPARHLVRVRVRVRSRVWVRVRVRVRAWVRVRVRVMARYVMDDGGVTRDLHVTSHRSLRQHRALLPLAVPLTGVVGGTLGHLVGLGLGLGLRSACLELGCTWPPRAASRPPQHSVARGTCAPAAPRRRCSPG